MQGDKILLDLLEQQKQMNAALQKNNENLVEQVRRFDRAGHFPDTKDVWPQERKDRSPNGWPASHSRYL